MFEETLPTRPMTDEEIMFEKLTSKIEMLEKLVGALAVTNFLTQHEDGDEEVREESVERVNEYAYKFKQDWKIEKKVAELEKQKAELDQRIMNIRWSGNVTFSTLARYSGLGNAILNPQQIMVNALNQSFQNMYDAREALKGSK